MRSQLRRYSKNRKNACVSYDLFRECALETKPVWVRAQCMTSSVAAAGRLPITHK